MGAGRRGPTFLPYLAGERTPHADPDARGAFTGLSCATTAARSSARCSRASPSGCATRSTSSRGSASPGRGRVSGGGARSELWLRIVASVLELPLERVAVEEGAAYGAALLGGVAGGVVAPTSARRSPPACARAGASSRSPSGSSPTATSSAGYRALYPAIRAADTMNA